MQDYNQVLQQLKVMTLQEVLMHKTSIRDHTAGVVKIFWDEHYNTPVTELTGPEAEFITFAEGQLKELRHGVVMAQADLATSVEQYQAAYGDIPRDDSAGFFED